MPIDWKAVAARLARPWWGPYAPAEYTMMKDGRRAGVGLLAHIDYGAWNLMLLTRGTFVKPASLVEHNQLIPHLLGAQKVSATEYRGQPLGSYLMLMYPPQFKTWLMQPEQEALGGSQASMLQMLDVLMKAKTT